MVMLSALALILAAIGLGRVVGPLPTWRRLQPVARAAVDRYVLRNGTTGLEFLDLDAGRIERFVLPEGDELDKASWSPWQDEQGRSQVVGRWASWADARLRAPVRDAGLARYSFPDGQVIDQVSTAVAPNSAPCWLPGTRARILFASTDGRLYRFDFEGATGPSATLMGRDAQPRPVEWRCDPPGMAGLTIREPYWPRDSRFGGRIVASLDVKRADPLGGVRSSQELWWLQLNRDATVIERAGPLSATASASTAPFSERCPVVGRTADGALLMAYLSKPENRMLWDVRVAPLDLTGPGPIMDADRSWVVAEGCQLVPPILSSDGRWTACVTAQVGARSTRRVDTQSIANAKLLAVGPKNGKS
jgi:hypothetical protein